MKKKLKDLTASDILEICDNFFLKRENRCSHNCPLYGYKSNKCRASYRQQHRDQEIEYRFAEEGKESGIDYISHFATCPNANART